MENQIISTFTERNPEPGSEARLNAQKINHNTLRRAIHYILNNATPDVMKTLLEDSSKGYALAHENLIAHTEAEEEEIDPDKRIAKGAKRKAAAVMLETEYYTQNLLKQFSEYHNLKEKQRTTT